jgi:hypothetical protein
MQTLSKTYFLNPKWSEYPYLRICVNVELNLIMDIAGTETVRVTGSIEQVSVQVADIVQHRESAWLPLYVPNVVWGSENFARTVEILRQAITKNDGMK